MVLENLNIGAKPTNEINETYVLLKHNTTFPYQTRKKAIKILIDASSQLIHSHLHA